MAQTIPKKTHPFQAFLRRFIQQVALRSKQHNQAAWILETTGSPDAASLKGDLDAEVRLLFNSAATYKKLLLWDKDPHLADPLLRRQLSVLLRAFKQNQIAPALVKEIAQKEAALAQSYANFRPELDNKKLSENDLRELLKKENNPAKRQRAWAASKEIGSKLAPQILELVKLRNTAAKKLGYPDYFQMQLDLQEVDSKWLLQMLEELGVSSDKAYGRALGTIHDSLCQRFQVPVSELGPWAWSDPFCQEDPLDSHGLDELVKNTDIEKASVSFYEKMGIDVKPILARSDMYERPGKNQHAFCIHMDREGDIRTLNNINSSLKWLEVVMHELGHAVYELGFDPKLPWLLREPPHMITTEAMALIAGRQAYQYHPLQVLVGSSAEKNSLFRKADESHQRRQLIFSRWVLVMTAFESELYRDPEQDLNALWWNIVEKYQKIAAPKNRTGCSDWAAKYHIGLAPVYYFSYLLGELFASSIQETLEKLFGSATLSTPKAGKFLQEKLFSPGNRMSWSELVKHVTGAPLSPKAWLKEFAKD